MRPRQVYLGSGERGYVCVNKRVGVGGEYDEKQALTTSVLRARL